MNMPSISENQNQKDNLAKRVACKELYSYAKNLVYLELFLALFVGVMYILYAFSNPLFTFLNSNFNQWIIFPFIAPLLSIIFTIVDNYGITRFIKLKVEQAAYIQEDFDRNVFELPKNDMIIHSFDYVVYVMSEDKLNAFKNWYDLCISDIPIEFGRIIAQKSNCMWELNIKNDFITVLKAGIWIYFFIMIIVWFYAYDLKSIIIGFISLIYLANLFLKYYTAHKSSKKDISILNRKIDKYWEGIISTKSTDNLIDVSKDIQTQLYNYRINVVLVPDFFYRLKKEEHKDIVGLYVENMVKDYKINFDSESHNNHFFPSNELG